MRDAIVSRLSFSNEFISNLRTRWDERRKPPGTPGREKAPPSEPVYDGIYRDIRGGPRADGRR